MIKDINDVLASLTNPHDNLKAIIEAIEQQNVRNLRKAIKNPIPRAPIKDYANPVQEPRIGLAIATNNVDIVKIVFKHLQPFSVDLSLLSACEHGAMNVFDYLVEKYQPDFKKDYLYSPYIYTLVKHQHIDMLQHVLEKYEININCGKVEDINYAVNSQYGTSMKMNTIFGGDIDKRTMTAISEACTNRNIKAIDILMNHGADIYNNHGYAIECALMDTSIMQYLIVNNYMDKKYVVKEIIRVHNKLDDGKHDYVDQLFAARDLAEQMQEELPVSTSTKTQRNKI